MQSVRDGDGDKEREPDELFIFIFIFFHFVDTITSPPEQLLTIIIRSHLPLCMDIVLCNALQE